MLAQYYSFCHSVTLSLYVVNNFKMFTHISACITIFSPMTVGSLYKGTVIQKCSDYSGSSHRDSHPRTRGYEALALVNTPERQPNTIFLSKYKINPHTYCNFMSSPYCSCFRKSMLIWEKSLVIRSRTIWQPTPLANSLDIMLLLSNTTAPRRHRFEATSAVVLESGRHTPLFTTSAHLACNSWDPFT